VERRIVAGAANSLSWSTDSQYLVFSRFASETETGGVFLIEAQGGDARRLTTPGLPDSARTVAFSPDGRLLAVDFHVIELDELLNPRGPAKLLASRPAVVDRIAWTAHSSAVVLSEFVPGLGLGQGAGQQLVRIGIRGKTSPEPLSFAGQGATMATISRSGSRVAYSKTQANTDIWKLEGGVFARSPLSSTLHDGSPQFSPDGSKVAFNSNRSGNEEIWVANADGSGAIKLTS
jgi:Tol biopolymer transport system component